MKNTFATLMSMFFLYENFIAFLQGNRENGRRRKEADQQQRKLIKGTAAPAEAVAIVYSHMDYMWNIKLYIYGALKNYLLFVSYVF